MWSEELLQWQSWGVKEKNKGSDFFYQKKKKEVRWLKKMAQNATWEKNKDRRGGRNSETGRERGTDLSFSPVSVVRQVYAQQLCLSIKARGVCWTISQGEEGGKRGRREKRERKERAETLSSNSRKWVDPDRGRLCSLCGFNESTVFRTQRETGELA